jgi:uncharacterized membrane protein
MESRISLPMALSLGLNLETSLLLTLTGNALAIPLSTYLISKLDGWLLNIKQGLLSRVSGLYRSVSFKAAGKVKGEMEAWGYIGLTLFVAVPVPGSGVWTGALAAQVLRLNRRKTYVSLFIGQLIAAFLIYFALKGLLYFYRLP